jgi:hypothetical protein
MPATLVVFKKRFRLWVLVDLTKDSSNVIGGEGAYEVIGGMVNILKVLFRVLTKYFSQ